MPSPVAAIANLAVATYRYFTTQKAPEITIDSVILRTGEPLIDTTRELMPRGVMELEEFHAAIQILAEEPELSQFVEVEGQLVPMIMHSQGGSRQSLDFLILALLHSSRLRIYWLRLEFSEATFTSIVLENYEELKRGFRGETIRYYKITGYAGIELEERSQITTPWGTLQKAPIPSPHLVYLGFAGTPTTAIMLSEHHTTIVVSREPSLDAFKPMRFTGPPILELVPLAFALGTFQPKPCAPVMTFMTNLLPFMLGFSSTSTMRPDKISDAVQLTTEQVSAIEDWARRLNEQHIDSLKVAVGRVISAISKRADKSDVLIDAVTAWESLVGSRSETVFRVTAALAHLLEKDPTARRGFQKKLKDIYNLRSRVVHGDLVESAKIAEAADEATKIAIKSLSQIYLMPIEWLSMKSEERADRILLER
ncbi:hypothetical protein ACFQ08_00785 [Streptosporangium algeriense]|uniref:Apea-like HEPN domain-containing protein n=1 Tax=Streptosporangium algeriense TaxID=1682748 RepID=A0ABW3DKL4_9ACTN